MNRINNHVMPMVSSFYVFFIIIIAANLLSSCAVLNGSNSVSADKETFNQNISAKDAYIKSNKLNKNKKYRIAMLYLNLSAKKGFLAAQKEIASIYFNDKYKSDKKLAAFWYKRAASQDDVESEKKLALMYFKGIGVEKNFKKAFKWYMKAAMHRDAYALSKVAIMYDLGLGVKKNENIAFRYSLQSARLGSVNGEYLTGISYLKGSGVTSNYSQAIKWLEKSSVYKISDKMAKDEESKTAGQADFVLFTLYLNEKHKNLKKALYYLKRSSNLRNPNAMYNLGWAYSTGKLVSEDSYKALRLLSEAKKEDPSLKFIDENIQHASINAVIQAKKYIKMKKLKMALNLLNVAASYNSEASFQLGRMYISGEAGTVNYNKGFHYFKTAAYEGNIDALTALGESFWYGIGTTKDRFRGTECLLLANYKGSNVARKFLNNYVFTGWKVVSYNIKMNNVFLINTKNIKYRRGRYAQYWVMVEPFTNSIDLDEHDNTYTKSHWIMDCTSRKVGLKSFKTYDNKGNILKSSTLHTNINNLIPVTSNTPEYAEFNYVCNGHVKSLKHGTVSSKDRSNAVSLKTRWPVEKAVL